jgi:hypothetical protein
MGLNFLWSSGCSCTPTQVTRPNPNPYRFRVIRSIEVLDAGSGLTNLVCELDYADCPSFEGRKVLLYLNSCTKLLESLTFIDPHFSSEGFAPFARFIPTEEGWKAALALASCI